MLVYWTLNSLIVLFSGSNEDKLEKEVDDMGNCSWVDPDLCEKEMKHQNMIGTQKCNKLTFYYLMEIVETVKLQKYKTRLNYGNLSLRRDVSTTLIRK